MKKSAIALALSTVALGAALTACNNTSTQATAAFSGPVVATVNKTNIYEAQLNVLREEAAGMNHGGMVKSDEELMTELVKLTLLEQKAIEEGIDKDQDLMARIAIQRASVLANTLLKKHVEAMDLSDDKLKAEYDKEIASKPAPMEYKARHILLKTEEDAKAVIAELDKGADFAELAKQKSTGPTGPNGGDLGWFQGTRMVKPFADAVASMDKDTYSKTPVQTQFGWHVIKLEDSREMTPPAFDAVKDKLKNKLISEEVENYINHLKDTAKVDIKIDLKPKAVNAADDAAQNDQHG